MATTTAKAAALALALSVAILSFGQQCRADTPGNCTYSDAVGEWSFYEAERFGGLRGISCNSGSVQYKYNFTIRLKFPDLAVDGFGNVGFWTLVYNQGIEVVVAGRKYFGFFAWRRAGNAVVSICNQLLPNSTSHDALNRNWACFRAVKRNTRSRPKVAAVATAAEAGSSSESVLYRPNADFIDAINSAQSTWTAGHYPEYALSSLADLQRRAGGRASRVSPRPRARTATGSEQLLAALLPESWDWRNIDGVSFVSPVRNQGSCGSCYGFSSTGMIEARLKILTKNSVNYTLSEQDVIECSPYSQGCDGGFPYLIAGKYAEDYGLALEACNPYRGQDGTCRTKQACRRVYATDYKYVGGYYGACSEEAMMIALVNHGPMSVSFEVYSDFQHYKGGIYQHTGLTDRFNPFEVTNHAVLLVGYGIDANTGMKYWIVKNSWGSTWGENGYFRIARGQDECAIESIAVEASPIMP